MLGSLWFNSFSSGGGGAAAYELISTSLISTTTSSVTFDVSTLASTYKHLQLRVAGRADNSGSHYVYMGVRFNSDTGANYSVHELYGAGSSVASGGAGAQTSAAIGYVTGAAATSGNFGATVADILDPFSTTKNKTIRGLAGVASTSPLVDLRSSAWYSTAAVTSINVLVTSGSFVSGSRLSLYGIRGS